MKNELIKLLTMISPRLETKIAYKHSFGKKINLKNPTTINEKILWLKLNTYYNDAVVTMCIDKYMVRNYLEKKNMTKLLPKLYGVYDRACDINFDKLPNSFVIKCNHGCGYNIIVPNKKDFNTEIAINDINKWMKEDYWKKGGEIQYKYVNKKIIIEEYLGEVETYKFFCFNGEPQFFYLSTNEWNGTVYEKDKYIDFFDINFNNLHVELKGHPNCPYILKKPEKLNEMINISKQLAKDFPFVRLDLYFVNNKIYFSEYTFIPTNGFMHLKPKRFELEWGNLLNISMLKEKGK